MTFVYGPLDTSSGGGGNPTYPITGTVTTTTDTPTPIIVLPLDSNVGTWLFEFKGVAYDVTDQVGQGTSIYFTITTSATLVTQEGEIAFTYFEDPTLSPAEFQIEYSSNPNILTINVVGLNGPTINWSIIGNYLFVG